MKEKKEKKDPIQYQTTKAERFNYGLYFLGQLISYGLVVQFMTLYMTDMGIPAISASVILIITKVWDAVNDPLFGVIVDKAHPKGGKYIPWVRLSTYLIAITTTLLFSAPAGFSASLKAVWVTVGYVLWDTAYTMCDVPIFALATSMTDDLDERNRLYIVNRYFTLLGAIVVVMAVPMLYPKIGWAMTALVLSLFAMATMIPIGYTAKERVFTETEKNPSIKELLNYLLHNKPLLIFSGACIVSSILSTGSVASNYVALYCLGSSDWITYIALITSLPMLITIVAVQAIIKKVDKYYIYIGSCAITMALGIVQYFVGYENQVVFALLAALKSVFSAAAAAVVVMLTADCAEYGHFTTGERAQGVAFSVQTFTAKFTAAISSSMGMLLLGLAGFVEGENAVQTADTVQKIWGMYTLIPVISGTAALLIMVFFYKLRTPEVEIMTRANNGELSHEEAERLLAERRNG